MRKLLNLLIFILLAGSAPFLQACSDAEDDAEEETTEGETEVSLSVSPTSVSVAAEGESFTVIVTCNTDYNVAVSDSWLSLDSDNGGSLSFTVAANTSESSRTASITITAGDLSGTVTVTQEGADDSEDSSDDSDDPDDGSDDSSDDSDDTDDSGDSSDDSLSEASGTINGYEYVDLGLSVKWAMYNVGADSPEEFGNYYAWGETDTKSSYSSSNSITYGIDIDDIAGNTEYDAAAANWGDSWRLPTGEECEALIDSCTWAWTTLNDVNGYKVTGTNDNSIFLPYAGYYRASFYYSSGGGCYWSSTPASSGTGAAECLYFISSSYSLEGFYRYRGQSVRAVSE